MLPFSGSIGRLASSYLIFVALFAGIAGLILAVGGTWLFILGGSVYYLLAGSGLLVTAALIWMGRFAGLWVYLGVYLGTFGWAIWEKGENLWAQVPRLVAPTVMLILILIAIPILRQIDRKPQRRLGQIAVGLGLIGVLALPLFPRVPLPAEPQVQGAAAVGSTEILAASSTADGDWPAYGGGIDALRYAPIPSITPANVGSLQEVWRYSSGDMPGPEADGKYAAENTPLKVGDQIFVCSAMGIVSSLDAATGVERWRFDPKVKPEAIPYGATCRGVAYHTQSGAAPDAICASRILWGTLDARLMAVDARTGVPCPDFADNGTADLNAGIGVTVPGWYAVTSPPTIVRGVAVLGAQVKDGQAEDAPSGVVRGYDAVTGNLLWAWDLGNPDITTLPSEGEVYTRGTPNMWTIATGDDALGLVYLPMGNSSVDYWGSNRSEAENTYSTALVALNVATGRPVWHFQSVIRDVWDYDLGSQATVVDLTTDAGTIPALILPSKQGDIYVLDRRTGEPLVPIDLRSVPQGGVEPDYLSADQPFSTYHTVAQRDLVEADMWGFTPIDQLWCRIQFRQASYEGIYTPPSSDRPWIQYPGYNGGSDWGGVAVDPVRGILIANYNDTPNFNRLVPRAEADAAGLVPIYEQGSEAETVLGEAGPQTGAPYAIDVNAGWRVPFTGLLCKEPPYGGIRAIDINSGKTLWDRPLGSARRNGPFGIPTYLPMEIGTPNNGGSVVTSGGLIFIAAATDNLFRAIDITTGETVWQVVLPGGGQANPFAFQLNGRDFVGIMAGGHHFMETPISDEVIVWALPQGM